MQRDHCTVLLLQFYRKFRQNTVERNYLYNTINSEELQVVFKIFNNFYQINKQIVRKSVTIHQNIVCVLKNNHRIRELLMTSPKETSSALAALRHRLIRSRNISKYSITGDILRSICSSSISSFLSSEKYSFEPSTA